MYYLRARYYDPKIGRFPQEDPALDGDNWYAYANCNPIMFIDPSGKIAEAVVEQFLSSPIGQKMTQKITELATQAGVSVSNYVVQNWDTIQKAADTISQYGVAAWDWTKNTAVPWVQEKVKQAENAVGSAIKKATTPKVPTKLKDGNKVKTPESHPEEFKKQKDGSYKHEKTGWTMKKDPSGHGGPHYDASPPFHPGHINVGTNGNIY